MAPSRLPTAPAKPQIAEAFTEQIKRLGTLPAFFQTLPLAARLRFTRPLPRVSRPDLAATSTTTTTAAAAANDDDDEEEDDDEEDDEMSLLSFSVSSSSSATPPAAPAPTPVAAAATPTAATTTTAAAAASTTTSSSGPPDVARTYDHRPAAYGRQTPILFHVSNVLRHLLSLYFDPQRAFQTIELYAAVVPNQADPQVSRVIELTDLFPSASEPARQLDAILPATFKQKVFPKEGQVRVTLRVFKMALAGVAVNGIDDVLPHMRVEAVMINRAGDRQIAKREEAVANVLRDFRAREQAGLASPTTAGARPFDPALLLLRLRAVAADGANNNGSGSAASMTRATAPSGSATAMGSGPNTGSKRKRGQD